MQEINGALFFKTRYFYILSLFNAPATVTTPLTTMYVSLKSHKADLSIDVLNLICLFELYLFSAVPDGSYTSIHFLVINLGTLSGMLPNKFFYMMPKTI